MKQKEKIKDKNYSAISFSASIALHIIIFFAGAFFLRTSIEKYQNDSFVQVETVQRENTKPEKENLNLKRNENPAPKLLKEEDKNVLKKTDKNQNKIENISSYLNFNSENSDTSKLEQIYKESTLNVSLKYPLGWKYVDQNVKNKLDGITFWSVKGNFSPPPYVHFEVKEKYLFDKNRFKYNFKTRNYTAYYNDPEELSGQVSQTIYIRTENEKDFSIKLIMEGKENFKSFQPEFFGMVKSFKFGESIF